MNKLFLHCTVSVCVSVFVHEKEKAHTTKIMHFSQAKSKAQDAYENLVNQHRESFKCRK